MPLTWCGILPYRCGHCHTRFYRLGWGDPRRWHPHLEDPSVDDIRPPRWSSRTTATLTVDLTVGSPVLLTGRTENLSVRGARVRLPEEIPVGTSVRLSVKGERPRLGTVRWSKADESAEFLHGVEFEHSTEQGAITSRPLRVLRRRRRFRRVLIGLIVLALIGLTAAGLVWLMETLRIYSPNYYEPKDIERERYEMQQRTSGSKPGSRNP